MTVTCHFTPKRASDGPLVSRHLHLGYKTLSEPGVSVVRDTTWQCPCAHTGSVSYESLAL